MGTRDELGERWEDRRPAAATAARAEGRSAHAAALAEAPLGRDWVAEQAADSQRRRMLDAVAAIVAERGLRGASVAAIVRRARVSRDAFGEHFRDVDHCFATLLEATLEDATALAAETFERQPCWCDGILAGVEALLTFLDANPVAARACLLAGLASQPPSLASSARALDRLRTLVDQVRVQLSHERQPPAAMAEATVGSVIGILRRRLLTGEAPPFIALLGELVEVVFAPYLGPRAAAEAASAGHARARALLREGIATPAASFEVPKMLRHARARRLRSCLRYLAEHAEASNQAVATGIGVAHPGQASALLARLHDAGLLVKQHGGAGRPNAWSLSPRGAEVTRALDHR